MNREENAGLKKLKKNLMQIITKTLSKIRFELELYICCKYS